MKQVQRNRSLIQEINTRYQQEMKHLKKKKLRLKIKLLLTVVFPFLIVAIFIEVARTFIRIKLRKIFTKPFHGGDLDAPSEPAPVRTEPAPIKTEPVPVKTEPIPVKTEPAPVKTEPVPKEIVKPQPVSKKEL